jgi:hypothetical protein
LYLGVACAFLYVFPYWGALRNANEMPRVALAEEIVDHATFRLDARWDELSQGSTFDVAITPDDHKYSNKPPGASLVCVPAYLALVAYHRITGGRAAPGEVMWAFRLVASIVPALVLLPVFRRTARRFASAPAADAAAFALGFGSMIYPYAHVLFSHALAAACAGGGFAAAVALARGDARRPTISGLAVGFLLGWAVLCEYQSLLALVVVAGYAAVRRPRALPAIALGGLPPASILGGYHWACFGAPWITGYRFAADPAHREGLLGLIGPNREALIQALFTFDNGLVVLMPWIGLAGVGAVVLWRRRVWRAEAVACGLIALGYVFFVGSLVPEFGRAGWSVGPRYIAVALPWFAWLLAAALDAVDHRPAIRTLVHALILDATVVMVVATTTLPYWPTEIRNPLYEVGFWALARGYVAPSLGTLVGLRGVLAIAPLYALICAIALVALGRARRSRTVASLAAAAVAALWIGALGLAPRTFDTPTQRDYLARLWIPGALF